MGWLLIGKRKKMICPRAQSTRSSTDGGLFFGRVSAAHSRPTGASSSLASRRSQTLAERHVEKSCAALCWADCACSASCWPSASWPSSYCKVIGRAVEKHQQVLRGESFGRRLRRLFCFPAPTSTHKARSGANFFFFFSSKYY